MGRFLWLYQATGLQKLVRSLGLTRILPKKLREMEALITRLAAFDRLAKQAA